MSRTVPPPSALRAFLASEAAGGIILMVAAACAMIVANSPLGTLYHDVLHTPVSPALTDKLGPMTPHLWINDGLMAIFFLFVGLEIKRELVDGRLSTWPQRRLPVLAAAAGMAVPALVYLAFTSGDPALTNGWAIPAATDIAFAIGVLALLGPRAPTSLKLFLVTVAIVDDMGAVAIIALFYTAGLKLPALLAAALILAMMFLMNRLGVRSLIAYLIGFAFLWYAVLLSGVHATIAGVLTAFALPIHGVAMEPGGEVTPAHRLERALTPWVGFVIVPLFGFANAGVSFAGLTPAQALTPLPLAIATGLFLGKQVGIFAGVRAAVGLGWASRPAGATWAQVYGTALLCGIGFTMSLFIGGLAFPNAQMMDDVKIGVLLGSLVSAVAGYTVLRVTSKAPGDSA